MKSLDWNRDGNLIVGGDVRGMLYSFDANDKGLREIAHVETAGYKKTVNVKRKSAWI